MSVQESADLFSGLMIMGGKVLDRTAVGDIALAGSGDHEFFPGFRFSLQDESAVFFRKSRAEQAGGCARIETGGAAADDNKPIYGRSIVFFNFSSSSYLFNLSYHSDNQTKRAEKISLKKRLKIGKSSCYTDIIQFKRGGVSSFRRRDA